MCTVVAYRRPGWVAQGQVHVARLSPDLTDQIPG